MFLHIGSVTRESRGMLMPMARVRSPDTWKRIVVSLRCPAMPAFVALPYFLLLPLPVRESEPMTRTFTGSVGVICMTGRSPSWSRVSTAVMLLSRRW
ncbi:MAG: hypothetical protein IPG68_04390 [Micrococcales bacterium]|nr:hypothetical protein [Micrococcales bacterium]